MTEYEDVCLYTALDAINSEALFACNEELDILAPIAFSAKGGPAMEYPIILMRLPLWQSTQGLRQGRKQA